MIWLEGSRYLHQKDNQGQIEEWDDILLMKVYMTQGAQPGALWWPTGVGWRKSGEAQEGGDICMYI